MNVVLLPLLPRGVDFRKRKFRLLKDRHIYDTESVATSDTLTSFFVTVSSKKKSQAMFTGDFSLVKEANLFLAVQLQVLNRDRLLTRAEAFAFWNKGSYIWNVTVPETVTVDEDRLAHVADGIAQEQFANTNALDNMISGNRRYEGRRTYLVGANKIVPGGRAIEFNLKWEESGGNGLLSALSTSVIFAGGEYEPGNAN